jgi:hypothetical protein
MDVEHRGMNSKHATYGEEAVVGEGLGCRSTAYNAGEEEEGGHKREDLTQAERPSHAFGWHL